MNNRYVEYHGFKQLFNEYMREQNKLKQSPVSKHYLYKIWRGIMNEGVINPDTGKLYRTHVRQNSAVGFSQCDECTRRAAAIAAAKTLAETQCARRKLKEHQDQVKADRIEMARIARLCKIDQRHVGVMIDAVDRQKFGIPTTERQSKNLAKMDRIIQKITGVRY